MPFFRYLAICTAVVALATGCSGVTRPNRPASPNPPTGKVKMELVTINKENVSLGLRQRLQFAKVSGLPDQAMSEKINKRLRNAAEGPLDSFEKELAEPEDPLNPRETPNTTMMHSEATIGLVNSRVVAVNYRFSVNGAEFGRFPAWSAVSLVIDVADGHELTVKEMLSSRVGTTQGARDFTRVLARSGPGGRLCDVSPPDVRGFTPKDIVGEKPGEGVVDVFPTTKGVDFTLGLWKLGYPMACNAQVITVSYPALKGLLGPALTL